MKRLLLAGAVMAAVGCSHDPSAVVAHEHTSSAGVGDRHSDLLSAPPSPGPTTTAPTTTVPEPTTTTTEAPVTTTAAPRRTTTTEAYEAVPSPQGRSTGRGGEPPAGDVPPDYIKQCESGGNYRAVNPASGAGGAWQFLPSTWRSVGGTGLPQDATPAEQDYRASILWAGGAGASHWACA